MNATQARIIRIIRRILATSGPMDRAAGDAVVILMAAGMSADVAAAVPYRVAA